VSTPRARSPACRAPSGPKAVAKITDDEEELLAFFDYPAEHWIHLRTTNPIVIWGLSRNVLDVVDEAVRSPVLRAGRGYLPLSMTRILEDSDAGGPCGGARIAA
jgi:hypothetical protein